MLLIYQRVNLKEIRKPDLDGYQPLVLLKYAIDTYRYVVIDITVHIQMHTHTPAHAQIYIYICVCV